MQILLRQQNTSFTYSKALLIDEGPFSIDG